jgi:ATP-dependent helicase STH1/SNF2
LRRVKIEVEKELPNKIEMVVKVDLSAWQRIVYNGIKDNNTLARDPSTGKIGNLALRNTVMQLRKICNHPYLFLDYYEPEDVRDNIFRSSGKFELLDRILPKFIKTGHKILIFS